MLFLGRFGELSFWRAFLVSPLADAFGVDVAARSFGEDLAMRSDQWEKGHILTAVVFKFELIDLPPASSSITKVTD